VRPFDIDELLKADGVRPPRQDRSRATFERLLDAAQELLERDGVDGISMAAVVRRAGSSIGALYTRVPDKATLVRAVQLRLVERQLGAVQELAEADLQGDTPLEEIIGRLLTMVTTSILADTGLLRAIVVQGMRDRVMRERVSIGLESLTRLLADVLRHHPNEHAHRDPELAADMVVRTVSGVLQQVVLLQRPFDERLAGELRTLVLRYLGEISQARA
jgi:AcrR family transcriptional regulator